MKKPFLDPTLWRELSARTVLFHHAVAERMGLSLTDHKVIDLLQRHTEPEHVTPGVLADLTGLTTGAITGVLDRLETAGFVRREKDPSDRRQILVRLLPQRLSEFAPIFEPMAAGVEAICADYTQKELDRIADFITRCNELTKRETERLRKETMGAMRAGPAPGLSAPRGRLTEATFEAKRGAFGLALGACDEPHLFAARFEGNPPAIEASGDVVTFTQGKVGALDWLRSKKPWTRVDLSRLVAWTLRLKGGAGSLDADLREVRLAAFDLAGGADKLRLHLGHPSGVVPVRVRGGASELRVLRPRHAATKLTVHGGVGGLTIDGMKLGSVGGVASWESPDAKGAKDRFELDLTGGASDLVIETG